jgi:glucan phosphoethanolaminetransferase (alkaline phosphatase superfamily)
LNCAKCGKEIQDKKSSFCAYCGVPFDTKPQNTALTTVAGTLAIIAAAFSAALGTIGIVYYQSYIAYYTSLGYDTSGAIGFLLFAIFAYVASAFGFAAATLTLARKRFKIAVAGTTLMLASTIFTFIASWYYQYGYTEGILLAGISIGAFSIASTVFIINSKTEFAETTEPEPEEPEPTEPTETTETEPQQSPRKKHPSSQAKTSLQ